ncbi:MAG: hypothetical protein KBC69_00625 [Candidatus Magasanikbacteria bacterium]|nr:hypothetical protein [Candidatus Magasanikbacteria bacterium]
MDIKIEILIGAPTSVLGALGIRGAKITLTPRQKGKSLPRLWIDKKEHFSYFFTIEEAQKGLDRILISRPRIKIKILRRLRKAGLFWDMESVLSYCQKLAVIKDSTYDFVKCTRCAYASLVPHGWIVTEGKLIQTKIPILLHQQVTNLKDLIFRFCAEGVWLGEIPLKAALWVIHQGAKAQMGADSRGLLRLLLQDPIRHLRGPLPTDHHICRETGP